MKKKINFLTRLAIKLYEFNITMCYRASLRQAECINNHIVKSRKYMEQAKKLIKEKDKWMKRLCK